MFDFVGSNKGAWIYRVGGVALSVVVGLLSIVVYPLSGLLALIGVSLGVYALINANRSPVNYGSGSAKLLILGSVVAFVVFAAIAAPSGLTAKSAVNETSAVRSLLAILDAQRTKPHKNREAWNVA